MKNLLHPPAHKPLIDERKIDKTYKQMRWKVFLGAFIGYAAYYLVRKNLSLAAPGMIEEGLLDKASVGIAGSAISIAYAFSKFIMGSISDRSDARKFLVVGLILSSLLMIGVGLIPFSAANITQNVIVIFVFMLLVGWLSGMGWPPCGRIMAHWFSQNERSFKMSVWNTSHTIGSGSLGLLAIAGVVIFGTLGIDQTWRSAFIFPSVVALLIAGVCWWLIRDTPQSCGLPPIDEYRNDFSGRKGAKGEEVKIPFKRLFVDYIFKNKILWLIAFGNAFVYLIRYGISDWAPVYLQEMDIMNKEQSSLAFSLHNYAGIPGTIICGWISAKFFKGRCAPANVIYMVLVFLGILLYWQALPVATWIAGTFGSDPVSTCYAVVYVALCEIGFCIYGPVALIGVQALNLVPKNAAGTAAGFVGLFGYLVGDAVLAKIVMGSVSQSSGWNAAFWMFIVASIIGTLLCATTWKKEQHK
jgi:OPA family glycerol-3-phosphate transporter-like MFS transporter